jgi:hypothetical protein
MMAASKAVLFPVFSQRTEPITQLELELFLSLRNRLQQLEAQVGAQEAALKSRLEAGETVEPGVHVASLKESFRRNVSWKSCTEKLARRLKLTGYCERVLAATRASRSVSLEVQ